MNDTLKNRVSEKSMEKPERESVRGKLTYYQELIHQMEKRKKEEEELEI